MLIIHIEDRNPLLIEQLVQIWKDSVKATHVFLSDLEIDAIQTYLPQALSDIPHLLVITVDEHNVPAGFMGIAGRKLEMLFITPQERGGGLGSKLVEYGMKEYSMNEVCVNEQNPLAIGYYQHMGFQTYKRTETDDQGMPYPILHMKLLRE